MNWQYKQEHSLEQRRFEAERIRRRYPDRIPVIVSTVPFVAFHVIVAPLNFIISLLLLVGDIDLISRCFVGAFGQRKVSRSIRVILRTIRL